MKWYLITRDTPSFTDYYPTHSLARALNAEVIRYNQLNTLPEDFFDGKTVILQMMFVDDNCSKWLPHLNSIYKAKNLFVEIDGDNRLTTPHEYDFITKKFGFISTIPGTIIWEASPKFKPFLSTQNTIQLRAYDSIFQTLGNSKSVDVLGYIHKDCTQNAYLTLTLLHELSKGYNVRCLVRNKEIFDFYKKRVSFPLVYSPIPLKESRPLFRNELSKAKVFLDLTHRYTMGRNIYEALYKECIAVGSGTYGASHVLFPRFTVDELDFEYIINLCKAGVRLYEGCILDSLEDAKSCSIESFVEDLKKEIK